MVAALDNSGQQSTASPVPRLLAQARQAAQAGAVAAAIQPQEEAVALLRQAGEERETLVTLSVLLFNLAGYYQTARRFSDAVTALEEVVALDERTGHEDLESDRAALAHARALAANPPPEELPPATPPTPNEADLMAAMQAQLAQLPPAERAQAEAAIRAFAALSPAEQAEQLAASQAIQQRQKIESLAVQTRDAAIAAQRGELDTADLAGQMEALAAKAADGETAGSAWDELAQFVQAVAAHLRGQPLPPVPTAYAAQMAAILETSSGRM
jgi:hypothetical protein